MSGAVESQDTPTQRRKRSSRKSALAIVVPSEDQGASSQTQHETSHQTSRKAADDPSSSAGVSGEASALGEGGSGDGESSKTQDEGSPKPASSPEPNCAICLGTLENKSFTDSCFHMFCFVCLQEWSKVKAECPLCKQPFKSIIHNVRSYDNYDQFYLDHHRTDPLHFRPYGGMAWDRPFHHYRSTLTMDHRYMRIQVEHDLRLRSHPYRHRPSDDEPSLQRPSRHGLRRSQRILLWPHARQPATTTVDFRRRIYESSYRVTGVQTTQRYRQVSPEFFSTNPAQTHRLMPWLNRELNALLYCHESQVQFVMELILDLVKRFAIDSEEFYQHISPYIGRHTRHFMHEFLSFARSPYHMTTYDTKAVYEPFAQLVSSSESSDNESDVVVIDDDDAEEAGGPNRERREAAGPSGQGFGREPPAVRLGFDSNYLPTPATSQLRALLEGTSSNNQSSSGWDSPTMATGWDSPTPGPSWSLSHRAVSASPVNVEDSSDSDASTIIDPTYISPQLKDEADSRTRADDSDEDEEAVIFVGYDKPWEERSPIHLTTDSEDEVLSKFAKKLKQEHKKRTESSTHHSSEGHSSRTKRRERSRTLTPPATHRRRSRSPHSKSPHSRSGSHRIQRSSTEGSSHRKAESYRRHHFEESVGHRSSSYPTSSSKRSHSSSSLRSKSGHKKRRHDKIDDPDSLSSSSHKKKHKHKKHKKHKDKRDGEEHSRRHKEGQSSGKSDYKSSSSSSKDRHSGATESFKKHPSGHKKSRVHDSGDHAADERRGSLLSDGSGNTPTSTVTTTAPVLSSYGSNNPMDSRGSNSSYPFWSPLQMLMNDRLQHRSDPSADVPPTWENIKRLAGLLSFSASTQQPAGPCKSTSEPVVISTSSDESDKEDSPSSDLKTSLLSADSRLAFRSGDGFGVAETVVVPCSSRYDIPAEGTDTSIATGSSAEEEELIDVDSLSSTTESDEIVDVESMEEVEREDTGDVVSSLDRDGCVVAEVSAEPDIPVPLSFKTISTPLPLPPHSFSIDSILNRDVFMGFGTNSLPLFDQACVSSPSTSGSQDVPFTHSQSRSFTSLPDYTGSASVRSQHYSPEHRDACPRGDHSTETQRMSTLLNRLCHSYSENRKERFSPNRSDKPETCTDACLPSSLKQADANTSGLRGVLDTNSGDTSSDIDGFTDTEEEICTTKKQPSVAESREADESCDVGGLGKGDNCRSKTDCHHSNIGDTADSSELLAKRCESLHTGSREVMSPVSRSVSEDAVGNLPTGSSDRQGEYCVSAAINDAKSHADYPDICDSSCDIRATVASPSSKAGCPLSSGNPRFSSDFDLGSSSDELDAGEPHNGPSSTVSKTQRGRGASISDSCDSQSHPSCLPQREDLKCMYDTSVAGEQQLVRSNNLSASNDTFSDESTLLDSSGSVDSSAHVFLDADKSAGVDSVPGISNSLADSQNPGSELLSVSQDANRCLDGSSSEN